MCVADSEIKALPLTETVSCLHRNMMEHKVENRHSILPAGHADLSVGTEATLLLGVFQENGSRSESDPPSLIL